MSGHLTSVERLDGNNLESIYEEHSNMGKNDKIIRVGAYCRVSTDAQEQKSSLELQMASFRNQIERHRGWTLVDIYADEGISGGSVRRRKEFQRMVQDSKEGKLDYIITKSISRFARNTLECLTYVRELQENGTQIYFEKENIDTGTAFSEMLLTILAAFAQEESRSLSENAKWGIRKRFEAGQEKRTSVFGYRFDEAHNYVIEPDEADTIRRIFNLYETGRFSMKAIALKMMEEKRPSATCMNWQASHIHVILSNEKYIGDVLMQKKYTIDHMTHREVRNWNRVLPQFYVKEHHIPIITRKQFERCKQIAWMKSRRQKASQYPYNDLLVCPACQRRMRCAAKKDAGCAVWRCEGEDGCRGFAVKAKHIDKAMLEAYNRADTEKVKALLDGKNADAARAFIAMKKARLVFGRVDFYWLDELVDQITFDDERKLTVHWKCGLNSTVSMETENQKRKPPNPADMSTDIKART